MQQDYYKEYYDLERNHWWFVAREKIIANHVKKLIRDKHLPEKEIKILNVGCGPGRSSQYLSKFGQVTSIEYDKECCEFASEKTGLEIINGSITQLPFSDKSFDLVCAFDVIEHVEDDQLAVNEMKRVVKEDGVIFITVPAFMSLWSHHDVINHHFRRYKLPEVKKLFQLKSDGKIIFSSYFNTFLFPLIYLFRKLSNLFKTGEKRAGSGSDFEAFKPGLFNNILFAIMHFESKFINRNLSFPFGVSILYTWEKTKIK
jgi:SAM-dependent methyltransferase